MTKKLRIILIIVLISLLSFSLLILYPKYQKWLTLQKVMEDFQKCLNLENINLEENPEIAFCQALSQGKEICSKLSGEDDRKRCLVFSNIRQIIKAAEDKNLALCEKIGDDEIELSCQALLKNDIAICNRIPTFSRNVVCKAIVLNDENQCEIATTTGEKNACKDNFYHIKAMLNNNPVLCEKIEGGLVRFYCQGFFEPKSCQNIIYPRCFKKYAPEIIEKTNSRFICEEIPYKDDAYKELYHWCRSK
ncbi:MAG: hypothetical protein DRH33_05030 [Candidatus Nealsonbacteria bacterium]|nr:MAG: hypothetical protein DRH33_05030 [Candidatus Nealsonbacteria bacterium]